MQAKNDEKRKRARDRKMIRDGEYTNTKLNYIFFRSVKWSLMVPRWTSFWRDTQTIFDNIQILILFIFIFAVFECSFICNDMKKKFFFLFLFCSHIHSHEYIIKKKMVLKVIFFYFFRVCFTSVFIQRCNLRFFFSLSLSCICATRNKKKTLSIIINMRKTPELFLECVSFDKSSGHTE